MKFDERLKVLMSILKGKLGEAAANPSSGAHIQQCPVCCFVALVLAQLVVLVSSADIG
jgi:hypothetical protein